MLQTVVCCFIITDRMKRDKYEINEKTRAEFGGEIYCLRILVCDKSAPVVLFLHGGIERIC